MGHVTVQQNWLDRCFAGLCGNSKARGFHVHLRCCLARLVILLAREYEVWSAKFRLSRSVCTCKCCCKCECI